MFLLHSPEAVVSTQSTGSGGGGDDLAKSPHMARIANSVYSDVCPGDPTCSMFGFYQGGRPTPMMEKSLLYNMVNKQSGRIDRTLFDRVYSSKHGLVQIYKVMNVSLESKKWCSDPNNRVCDAPGSWYCPGQYPPAAPLQELFKRKRAFKQLEDFNKGNEQTEYHKEYLARMEGRTTSPKKTGGKDYSKLEDDEHTSLMWNLIREGKHQEIQEWLDKDSKVIHMRSADGRGPLWWAYEKGDKRIISLLNKYGAERDAKDKKGLFPRDLAKE
eukprot:TRINITY_DN4786_c0_g2_i3.p1 TRINITY_DN4786_c0_g2~~TRINITY_DN4786_c0_g2_i3.p1  ORF type:complete len:271 (+),score=72.43 TRINITY_DN4786_c0_g2_i3:3-815(+)